MQQYVLIALFIGGMCFGAIGGKFYGQANVLAALLTDKIECQLTVNPITMEKIQ